MKLITPPLEIKEGEAFGQDRLDREKHGKALLSLVVNSDDALVIALDGKWGEGKTTFVTMWRGLLDEEKVPNVYINAFANDYVNDPFISVVSAIIGYAEKKKKKNKVTQFKNKAIKISKSLLFSSMLKGVNIFTSGVINEAVIEKIKNTSDMVGDLAAEKINSYLKDIKLVEDFKKSLSELPSKLQESEKPQPLIIIIDELDRCKPTFAVELIERIKHLFSVENVIFLLVMNKGQLEESVKNVYGQKIKAGIYLQKFINIEMKLPKRTHEHSINDYREYINRLCELHQLSIRNSVKIDALESLAKHFKLSLRQLEKVFTNIAIFYRYVKQNDSEIHALIVFLATVKVIDAALFNDILLQEVTYQQVKERLNLNTINKKNKEDTLYWIMDWVRFSMLTQEEYDNLAPKDDIKNLDKYAWDFGSREQMLLFYARKINIFEVN